MIQARSPCFLAATLTFAPQASSRAVIALDTLPKPVTRHFEPKMVLAVSCMAMQSAPSAVGTQLRTIISSRW